MSAQCSQRVSLLVSDVSRHIKHTGMALLGGTAGWVRGLGLGEESVRDQRVAARQACGRVDRGVDGLRNERLGRWERGSSGLVEQGVDADGDDDGGGLREGVAFLVSFLVALQVSFGCCGTARGRKCGVVTGRWQGVVRRGHGGRGASSRPVVEVLQPNPTLQKLDVKTEINLPFLVHKQTLVHCQFLRKP